MEVTSRKKSILLLLFVSGILGSFASRQDLMDDKSLKLALRNVIEFLDVASNNLYAYKIHEVITLVTMKLSNIS